MTGIDAWLGALRRLVSFTLVIAGVVAACDSNPLGPGSAPSSPGPKGSKTARQETAIVVPPTFEGARHPGAARIVAIGDVHGDLEATRDALRLGGAIGDGDGWIGGKLVVVQTGDQLDRGDGEREIVELFDTLAAQARKAGGAVHSLNGNHETMNVAGDLRYVTPGGFRAFEDVSSKNLPSPVLTQLTDDVKGRAAAFFPGGPYARLLAKRDVVAIVGDSVFVHGGVLPEHVAYGIDRLNTETRAWMRGDRPKPPDPIVAPDGPVWTRRYSAGARPDCAALSRVLETLGAKRMVVGHTPQAGGANSACDGRVWRIDVGMARHYGGSVEVLEIRQGAVRVLRGAAR